MKLTDAEIEKRIDNITIEDVKKAKGDIYELCRIIFTKDDWESLNFYQKQVILLMVLVKRMKVFHTSKTSEQQEKNKRRRINRKRR